MHPKHPKTRKGLGRNGPFDPLSRAERSERMSRVRHANTKPELATRHVLDSLRVAYTLHPKDIPGKPDIVFQRKRKAIFINGCFWHLHHCNTYRLPLTRQDFWLPKLARNRKNDARVRKSLNQLGWHYITIWECEMRKVDKLRQRILKFLEKI
jgi:DNA mismatch endonuclease (patch repair protein)